MKEMESSLDAHSYFRRTAWMAGAFSLSACVCAALAGAWSFLAGILVGAAWTLVNGFFLSKLIEIGMQPADSRTAARVVLLSMLKFPALYVAGFFTLKSHAFPVGSLVLGLSLFIAAVFIEWARTHFSMRLKKQTVKVGS